MPLNPDVSPALYSILYSRVIFRYQGKAFSLITLIVLRWKLGCCCCCPLLGSGSSLLFQEGWALLWWRSWYGKSREPCLNGSRTRRTGKTAFSEIIGRIMASRRGSTRGHLTVPVTSMTFRQPGTLPCTKVQHILQNYRFCLSLWVTTGSNL